jgi:hypothetical protein
VQACILFSPKNEFIYATPIGGYDGDRKTYTVQRRTEEGRRRLKYYLSQSEPNL